MCTVENVVSAVADTVIMCDVQHINIHTGTQIGTV
jgi:hypothetical protein